MKKRRIVFQFIGFCVLGLCFTLLFSCKPEEIIYHGDLTGTVTDVTTSLPIQAAEVKLSTFLYPKSTDSIGKYLFKGLNPRNYELEVSKSGYDIIDTNVYVHEAKINTVDFSMKGIPIINLSTNSLEYMMDIVELPFDISNIGYGTLEIYAIHISEDWITLDPEPELITDQTHTINVTIDRTGLDEDTTYTGTIKFFSNGGDEIINVYINRSYYFNDERDVQQYKAIKIGNQWWMGKNLNIGEFVESVDLGDSVTRDLSNNSIIEKYCFENNESNCEIYGGLYDWWEMMDYQVHSDTGIIGTTQGICPDGWHIPTHSEWETLHSYLGEDGGGKLKETGTEHWKAPNTGATNESGFTALPGVSRLWNGDIFGHAGEVTGFWSATIFIEPPNSTYGWNSRAIRGALRYNDSELLIGASYRENGYSVRCVRDE